MAIAGYGKMQRKDVNGSLAAFGTTVLVTIALIGLESAQLAPVDEPDSIGAAPAVGSVGGVSPAPSVGFDMGFLDKDIFNRLVSEFSVMAPAQAVETGGPIADRILGPLELTAVDDPDGSTWTDEAARISSVFYVLASGPTSGPAMAAAFALPAAFAMAETGPWRIATEPARPAAPVTVPPASARSGAAVADYQADGYVVIGSFAVADNALAHASRHEKWHPIVMSAIIQGRDLLLVVVGPFIAAELSQMLELVVIDGIEDAWLFTPKGDIAAG